MVPMLQSPYARHTYSFFFTDVLAVWFMSQEAVHFESIDYSQKFKKKKIDHFQEINNVTMEFTSCKDVDIKPLMIEKILHGI